MSARPRLSRNSGLAAGFAWLALVGAFVWMHAHATVQPPSYDAFTYYLKARNVWAAIEAGRIELGVLQSVEPTFRPIGTVAMSYPWGFQPDVHAFYFRSVFVPLVLVFIATLVVGRSRSLPPAARAASPIVAAFLATLPIFFQFDLYDGAKIGLPQWGFVDGFMTAVASLASACAVRSVVDRRVAWGLASALVASFGIFVKPTGVPLAALVAAIAIVGWTICTGRADRRERGAVVKAATLVVFAHIAVIGGAVLLATRVAYLDAGNLMYGQAAVQVMRAELRPPFAELLQITYHALGPFFPIGIAATVIVWRLDRTIAKRSEWQLIAMALAVTAIGVWFWLFGSGGQTQVRYFPPFLYVAMMVALPPLMRATAAAPRPMKRAIASWMAVGIANTTVLLALPDPAAIWQSASGVNVRSGIDLAGLEQARSLVAHGATGASTTVTVYAIDLDANDAMFDAVFNAQSLVAATPRFEVKRPIDWQRPSAYRRDEIVGSDYLLFDPSLALVDTADVATFQVEAGVVRHWAASLGANEGIVVVASAPHSRLLRVDNHARLTASFEWLIATHRWRAVFSAANPQRWWTDDQVEAALADLKGHVQDIEFEALFTMRGAGLMRDRNGRVTLNLWLRPHVADDDWAVLVHLTDARGNPIVDRDIALGPLEPSPVPTASRYVTTSFTPPDDVTQVAIGLYRGKGETILRADRGPRDWGDVRVLLPLPPVERQPSSIAK